MIAQIENAMIARVAAVNGEGAGPLGYRIATLGTYGGQLDDTLSQAQPNFPAVWFALNRDQFARDQGNVHIWQPTWTALCATRSLRNEQARRHGGPPGAGGAGEVGAYQLAMDLRRLFVNQTLGLAIDAIRAERIEAVHTGALRGQPVAVYALHLTTAYGIAVAADDGAAQPDPLIFIHTDWAGMAQGITLEQEQ